MDPAVVELIRDQAIPVYLEDGAKGAELSTLPLDSYPTTFILQGEEVRASIVGGKKAGEYLQALKDGLASAG